MRIDHRILSLLLALLFCLGPLHAAEAEGSGTEGLRFSEIFAGGSGEEGAAPVLASDWIELVNESDEPISLEGLSLYLENKPARAFTFPRGVLGPGEYLLIYARGKKNAQGPYEAPFKLPLGGGERLILSDAALHTLDALWLPELERDQVYERIDDRWDITAEMTPGESNLMPERLERHVNVVSGDVIFTELMTANNLWAPDEDGRCWDYIELFNRSAHAVSLEGYALSDEEADLGKWRFPAVTLPAGGSLLLHCSGLDRRQDAEHLHTNFKLSKKGDVVFLRNAAGQVIDMVDVPELEKGTPWSLVDGEWTTDFSPTPGLANSRESAAQSDAMLQMRAGSSIRISEVMAGPDSGGSDWIELMNLGDSPVDLGGFGLSNRARKPRRWTFPQGTVLDPGELLGVKCVGTEAGQTEGLNAPFSLALDGGYTVVLSDPEGRMLDALYVPRQYKGVSYGRGAAGGIGYFTLPTPGARNGGELLQGRAPEARPSTAGGLFTAGQSFDVMLTAPADARIYYTLDCSEPTEQSALYTGAPIPVTGTTILRTRVYRDGFLPSLGDTQSYLYDVANAADVSYVVSLVSDPVGLYSDESGIMVMGPNATSKFPYGDKGKGANFWMDWERQAHVELFTGEGTAISQNCGIKLHGRNTRAYELKCFKVIARSEYGDSMFRYPLFSRRPYEEYEAFLLRYTGQDYKHTFMRDPVLTRLAANTDVLYQEHELCIVYLNGKYYSAMYVRENTSAFSICRERGWEGEEDTLDLVKAGTDVKQGSNQAYVDLKTWIKQNDTSTEAGYRMLDANVDIDNFLEHCALIAILGTPDTVNVKRYRNTAEDGKWRFVLYDVDRGLREDVDGFELLKQGVNGVLFQGCMKNERIRQRFFEILDEALGSWASSQALSDAVEAQYELIKPVLPDYLANLGVTEARYRDRYRGLLNLIAERPKQVLKHLKKFYGLSDDDIRRLFPKALSAMEWYK